MKFLVFEDDPLVAQALKAILMKSGTVRHLSDSRDLAVVSNLSTYDLFLVDLDLESPLSGLSLIKKLSQFNTPIAVITGRDQEGIISHCYELGATHYLTKPFAREDVEQIIDEIQISEKWDHLTQAESLDFSNDESLKVKRACLNNLPILLTGKSGTGKTVLAQKIHQLSRRGANRFVALNCSAFQDDLLESNLFGHCKGAFTGATQERMGKLSLADGGTLFLDEIATMSLSLQAKLLKAIEEMHFYPVGSDRSIKVDFRLITATCEDLEDLVRKGKFREDLFYRLQGIHIQLPDLARSKTYLRRKIQECLNHGSKRVVLTREALECLMEYTWPGNYRELNREIEVLKHGEKRVIGLSQLPSKFLHRESKPDLDYSLLYERALDSGLKEVLLSVESELIRIGLQQNEGHVRRTLKDLRISSQAYYRAVGQSSNVKYH
jgi:DNA-binding NtrC family response regulator